MADSLQHRLMVAADSLETLGNQAHDPTLTTTTCTELGRLLREAEVASARVGRDPRIGEWTTCLRDPSHKQELMRVGIQAATCSVCGSAMKYVPPAEESNKPIPQVDEEVRKLGCNCPIPTYLHDVGCPMYEPEPAPVVLMQDDDEKTRAELATWLSWEANYRKNPMSSKMLRDWSAWLRSAGSAPKILVPASCPVSVTCEREGECSGMCPVRDRPAARVPKMDMHADLIARLYECRRMIGNMCSEGRPPKMSIPCRPELDEDIVICRTISEAVAALGGTVEPPASAQKGNIRG